MEQKDYNQKELEHIVGNALRYQAEYPYSESVVKETLKDLEVTEDVAKKEISNYRNKSKQKSLEAEILKEDLRKVTKVITYPILANTFAPTLFRKVSKNSGDANAAAATFGGFIVTNILVYSTLGITAPALILPFLGIQLATNGISGIYEYIRHVKERAKEKFRKKKN